jgi:flagellar biosynthesis/type III secretory pathway M-ring protein FliF/YscJ
LGGEGNEFVVVVVVVVGVVVVVVVVVVVSFLDNQRTRQDDQRQKKRGKKQVPNGGKARQLEGKRNTYTHTKEKKETECKKGESTNKIRICEKEIVFSRRVLFFLIMMT